MEEEQLPASETVLQLVRLASLSFLSPTGPSSLLLGLLLSLPVVFTLAPSALVVRKNMVVSQSPAILHKSSILIELPELQ